MGSWLLTLINSPIRLGVLLLPFTPLELLLTFIAPLILGFILLKLLKNAGKRLVDRSSLKVEIKDRILHWYRFLLRLLFIILFIALISRLFGAKLFEYWKMFYTALNQPLLKSGDTSINFVTILLTIPVFYVASWAGRSAKGMMSNAFMKKIGIDEANQFSIANLLRYTVMIIVLLIGLSVIGINLSALTVIFGVLGLGLGFGLQSVVANFFAGVIIIITRPIKEGDFVIVEEREGTVVQIRVISTVINTILNETIIVPNSHLVSSTVYNNTYEDRSVVIRNFVGVSYHSDVDKVLEVLAAVSEACPFRTAHKAPTVRLREFGNSSLNFMLATWIMDVRQKFDAHHWINLEIWRAFKREGIEIPFPQLDLHVKEGAQPKQSNVMSLE